MTSIWLTILNVTTKYTWWLFREEYGLLTKLIHYLFQIIIHCIESWFIYHLYQTVGNKFSHFIAIKQERIWRCDAIVYQGTRAKVCFKHLFQVPGCGAGYFEDQDSHECELCPIGTYNDQEAVESCTSCPPMWTTLQLGSTGDLECRLSTKFKLFEFTLQTHKHNHEI